MLSKINNFLKDFKNLYCNRNILIILILGYASGIPFTLVFGTYTYRMSEAGVNLSDIGLFGLAALPFTIKFLWSPLVDGLKIPILYKLFDQRRSWIIFTLLITMLLIAKLGIYSPTDNLKEIVIFSLIISFVSATYDIAYDAYRVELLPAEKQGAAAGISVVGYRIGILASGGLTLIIADKYNWQTAFIVISFTLLVPLLFAIIAPKDFQKTEADKHDFKISDFLNWIKKYIHQPFKQFISQHKNWLTIIIFAVLYKFGDALLGKMANPFYQQMGFEKTVVAEITKFYGFITSIIGGLIGGWAVYKLGVMKSLLWFGILQMISNLSFVWQAMAGNDALVLSIVITIENITSSLGTSAFVAYLSGLCNAKFSATQYALLSSVASLGRYLTNAPSGYLLDPINGLGLSWEWFFIITVIASIPGLIMIRWLEIDKKV